MDRSDSRWARLAGGVPRVVEQEYAHVDRVARYHRLDHGGSSRGVLGAAFSVASQRLRRYAHLRGLHPLPARLRGAAAGFRLNRNRRGRYRRGLGLSYQVGVLSRIHRDRSNAISIACS